MADLEERAGKRKGRSGHVIEEDCTGEEKEEPPWVRRAVKKYYVTCIIIYMTLR